MLCVVVLDGLQTANGSSDMVSTKQNHLKPADLPKSTFTKHLSSPQAVPNVRWLGQLSMWRTGRRTCHWPRSQGGQQFVWPCVFRVVSGATDLRWFDMF